MPNQGLLLDLLLNHVLHSLTRVPQVISNDVFKAPVHRVLPPQSGQARHSAPFFFNPKPDAVIQPHPAFVTAERPLVSRFGGSSLSPWQRR